MINFRSEGRRFPKGRCLIPASHFFEFTGTKSPKSKWKFTRAGEQWFCFAGLWRPMPDGVGEACSSQTFREPNPAETFCLRSGHAASFRQTWSSISNFSVPQVRDS